MKLVFWLGFLSAGSGGLERGLFWETDRARPTSGFLFALIETGFLGAMVDIGLGPTYGVLIFRAVKLRNNHLVVSRLMPTIAPEC
jgi:hypothetical protein